MEKASLVLSIISLFLAFAHISFVFLLQKRKLILRDLFIWLLITIVSVFIDIVALVYQVMINITPIFPILGIVGLILFAISLIYLIHRIKNIKK